MGISPQNMAKHMVPGTSILGSWRSPIDISSLDVLAEAPLGTLQLSRCGPCSGDDDQGLRITESRLEILLEMGDIIIRIINMI